MPCFFHFSWDGVFDFWMLVQVVEDCLFAHLEANVGEFFANTDDANQVRHGGANGGLCNVDHGFEFDVESSHGASKLCGM